MDNYKDFLGKKVKVTVAFATAYAQAGATPDFFTGFFKNINDDSIILSDVSKEKLVGLKKETININNILINKNYIILIEEI